MRTSITLVTVALLLLLSFSPATATSPAPSAVETAVTVGLDGVAAEPAGGANQTHACTGNAPFLPLCTTGLHVRDGFRFGLGLSAFNYEGVLENRLDWVQGSFVLRCEVVGGSILGCSVTGPQPPAGTTVLHECRSLDRDTGLPGGSGSWGCEFID